MNKHIALLRGINVGGHRRVPMQELRVLAEDAGCRDVRTYVASGNLVLASEDHPNLIEATLERAIERRFGFAVDVVVRAKTEWTKYLSSNPFDVEGEREPNLVMLCIGKQPATAGAEAALRIRASREERVELRSDALWLYFGDGSGRSKMGVGLKTGVWTTRNLSTVRTIARMLS
jgi:uncharacterized protein (DUF1697 family)